MEAVDDGFTEIVKFLLEAGADPNIADEVISSYFRVRISWLLHIR
jgi:ankyrin repeat protein